MYLYLREGVTTDDLPAALLKQVGELTQVMELSLTPDSKLARAKVSLVLEKLEVDGFYLQMPPSALINAHLHFGD